MERPAYQLTRYPVGSLHEIWTISWPLILGLLSMSLMLFTDRFLLARYSIETLNAASSAGTAAWMFYVLPMAIAGITEVFVGRFHGERRCHAMGSPVWQMVWFCLLLWPIYVLAAHWFPPILFFDTPDYGYESVYFSLYMYAAPIFLVQVALSGYFVGSGRVKVLTLLMIASNVINLLLDLVFIFGWGPVPEMGIAGAAYASIIAETFHVAMLFCLFLRKPEREKHGTWSGFINWPLFSESIRIGFPAGLGLVVEIAAHFLLFRLMMAAGGYNLTITAVVQSMFLLVFFVYEGLSKGVTTICSNLHGGKELDYVPKVLWSALVLHTLFFVVLAFIMLVYGQEIAASFFSEHDKKMLADPAFVNKLQIAYCWMAVFFLFDGWVRVFAGLLTAAGDTKFLLYAGTILNIVAYVIPLILIVNFAGGGADAAWLVIACYSITMFFVYLWRYRSGKWQLSSAQLEANI